MANSFYQWLLAGIIAILHPFFVSVVELNHDAKGKSLEASVRIFSDDFENVLKKFGNTNVDLAKPTDKAATDKLVNNYITQKLTVKVDGKAVAFKYLGYEQKQESTWIYFEASNIVSIKKLDVNCSLLFEYQAKQSNIIEIRANGTEKSQKLDNPKTEAVFVF